MEEEKDISKLLEERVRLDSMLQEKFSKKITIMFTDIKGSTSFYETQGDIDGRVMVHRHNEIVLPIIERNKGTLLKTIGDATMSFYEKPEEGAQAAVEIQKALADYNHDRQAKEQIHVRIGLNYGTGIVEKGDVYGDIVNTASRVEALADGGEIMVTEDLYRAVRSHDEFIFRFFKTVEVKGKKEPVRAYRLLWQPEEVSLGRLRKAPASVVVEKDGVFVLDASLSGGKLKVSGVEKSEGEERAAKSYDEVGYDEAKVREHIDGITDLLNRANRRGKIGNDLLVKLKEYGRLLFDALVPVQVKEQLAKTKFRHLLISIDDSLVHIPWELLNDGRDFLCQRFAIGRTVSTRQRVSGVVRAVGRPLKMQILADPRGDLAASYEEGVRIKEEIGQFEDVMDVALKTTEVKTDYVKAKIRNFDIVHYAGHADHDVKDPARSGWLLQDGRVSAEEIIRMTGVMPMPSLVFSNACQTAQTDEWKIEGDYEQKIYGLANAFLLSGVQHYIGTFWEIPDEAGLHFAMNFYRNLVRGTSVGEAMRLARQALIEKYGEDMIVWASYLLYGDPLTKYLLPEAEAQAEAEPTEPRQVPVGADLRHGAAGVALPQPAKSSSMRNAVIAFVLVIAAGIGVYFVQTGKDGDRKKTAPVSGAPAVVKDDGKKIDELVASFAKDYREGKFDRNRTVQDDWTTPPLTIVFMEIKSDGSSANIEKMTGLLSQQIQETGRASVVEREILVKLLEELKLSSSALADPATALKIGKVLSARLIVTGSVIPDKKSQTVMLRFIDTETTAVRKVITAESAGPEMDKAFISGLGTKIVDFLKAEMQVRGKVTALSGDTCRINLGQAHGLRKGDRLEVVQESRPGSGFFIPVAEVELAEVGKDTATAKIAGKKDAVVNGAKIRVKQGS